jgi:hypothetical protein
MNPSRIALIAGMLAIAGAALYQAGSAAQQEKDGTKGDFAVRYARAQLRLAELTLQKAQEMNQKIPETLAAGTVEQFSDDVAFAKAQLESAMRGGSNDPFDAWLRRAEIDLRAAEARLQRAVEANKLVRGAYGPTDLERMRANIELARLRVERGQALAKGPADARLSWQIEMMNEGLNRVDEMVTLSIQNRIAEFF